MSPDTTNPSDRDSTHGVVSALKSCVLSRLRDPVVVEGEEVDLASAEILIREAENAFGDYVYDRAQECDSCGEEGTEAGECKNSKSPCGHHCNCSWTQDKCCWCGEEFGEVQDGPIALDLEKDLRSLLNVYSQENESNTPDFILRDFVLASLDAFNKGVVRRDEWYGIKPSPGCD